MDADLLKESAGKWQASDLICSQHLFSRRQNASIKFFFGGCLFLKFFGTAQNLRPLVGAMLYAPPTSIIVATSLMVVVCRCRLPQTQRWRTPPLEGTKVDKVSGGDLGGICLSFTLKYLVSTAEQILSSCEYCFFCCLSHSAVGG